MATQAFIIDLEKQILAANATLEVAEKALQYEVNGNTDTNLSATLAKGSRLYQKIQKARRNTELVGVALTYRREHR